MYFSWIQYRKKSSVYQWNVLPGFWALILDVVLKKKVYWGIKIFPTPGKLACDPNANPNDCPSNRVCQEIDGDGNATCVCDPRFYLTNNDGHCILGKLRQVWDKCEKFSIRKTHL